ncbi:MAG: serine/threonine-protein kinase [Candidatus Humimicrobiaceae bacterium]
MIKKINNYQILSKIASGGMSEVYLADDISSGKKVALKILDAKLSIDPEYLHRFKKEASICQQLDHKNIVKILSYGTFEESYYIAYEYIEGITLDKLIRQKDLTITEIENISMQILEGLSFAHSKNIIHRDIKPSNIMIEEGTVKILDFGIAKQELSATVTKTGLFMGSPHYVSPEQIEGHDIDYRSDIYSFGIVLYEMIEGRIPFSADTPWGIIRAHLDKEVPEITKDTPSYLKEVVYKCLSKSKEDRFKSANEIISVIANKEEIGKKTAIIDREFEATKKEEKQIDYTKLDMEYYEEKRKHKVKLLGAITIPILFIIIIIGIIIIVNLNNKNYIVENTPTSSFIITTIAAETTIQAIQTTTVYYETTTTQYHNTTTTSYSNKNYENDLAEEKFLDNMNSLLDEYNLAFNHMKTYHKEGWIFNDPNEIALEQTFLTKLQELSSKLEGFSFPSSINEGRGNLVNISGQLCNIESSVINCMKNDDFEGYITNSNNFWGMVDKLWNNCNAIINAHNKKYH